MANENKKIKIEEQDLFAFVFFPESIGEDKKKVIAADKSFIEIIDFYQKLKSDSSKKVDDLLKKKIASKIPAYTLENIIHLYALKDPTPLKQNGSRMAAGSTELKPKMTTKTFVDNDKEYLIKVFNYGGITKVFVFSTKDEVVKNFDVIIEPHNLIFHFDDNTEPLKIEKDIEAETIELRFN